MEEVRKLLYSVKPQLRINNLLLPLRGQRALQKASCTFLFLQLHWLSAPHPRHFPLHRGSVSWSGLLFTSTAFLACWNAIGLMDPSLSSHWASPFLWTKLSLPSPSPPYFTCFNVFTLALYQFVSNVPVWRFHPTSNHAYWDTCSVHIFCDVCSVPQVL